MAMLRYRYQKLFGLNAYEMDEEPTDEFFTNLYIYGQIQKKEELEMKQSSRK